MRPRREVLLTTFADPSTFPSVFETPATDEQATEATAVDTTDAEQQQVYEQLWAYMEDLWATRPEDYFG